MSSSAKRALRILDILGHSSEPLGVTELARQVGLPPGTVFRALDALRRSAFAERYQSSSRYVLGPAALRLRQSFFARFGLPDFALPALRRIALSCGETTSLIVQVGWYGLRIASVRGSNEITHTSHLGVLGALADHYAGMAILAHGNSADVAAYAAWGGANEQNLAPALEEIRRRGFAQGEAEAHQKQAAIAIPVRVAGQAVAAIAVEGPVLDVGLDLGKTSTQVKAWMKEAANLERAAARSPERVASPFSHLDPATVDIRVGDLGSTR